MLVPAILYKEEILEEFGKRFYSDDMVYYNGYLGSSPPTIGDDNDGNHYQYAIVDNGKLVGYFTYMIDWYSSCAHCFGLFSFDRSNRTIGLDVFRELKRIINDYKLHRMEWRMVGGNPVERHYDKFCKRYHGRKLLLHDVLKDRRGKYHDDVIYEIIF